MSRLNGQLHPCSEWMARLAAPGGAARLAPIYGDAPALLEGRRAAFQAALQRFALAFGDQPVAIYRVPARISLNPHSDHQGAWVPYGTHARELIAVCTPADGGHFEIVNTDPEVASPLNFNLRAEIAAAPDAWGESWFAYIEHPEVAARRRAALEPAPEGRCASINYVKAAALRLTRERPRGAPPGLKMALHGDIPQGGGMSSSSAIVVATACAINDLTKADHSRRALAELCGEAEWYVGTRGGSGDHAAMLLGHRAGLTHLCFRPPFAVRSVLHSPFPVSHQLILANSLRQAQKGGAQRVFFNRGVFAYRFAFLALQRALREQGTALGVAAETIEETTCLGDVRTECFSLATIYRLLMSLPERVAPAALREQFPEAFAAASRGCFGSADLADLPDDVPLRGAALYGLGRVDRGLVMPVLLARGSAASMAEFGLLMSITHDGDRVTCWRGGTREPYTASQERLGDAYLDAILAAAHAGSSAPRWPEAQLRRQPGFYGASTPELDRLVDAARSVPAVCGAGLMGAGGGGYVLILADAGDEAFEAVRDALIAQYYSPLDLAPDVEPWQPVDAAGALVP